MRANHAKFLAVNAVEELENFLFREDDLCKRTELVHWNFPTSNDHAAFGAHGSSDELIDLTEVVVLHPEEEEGREIR